MQLFFSATAFGDDRAPKHTDHLGPAIGPLVVAIICIAALAVIVCGVVIGLRINPLTDCPDPTNIVCGYR